MILNGALSRSLRGLMQEKDIFKTLRVFSSNKRV